MGAQKPEDADICPVDLHVKSKVIIDSVNLARKPFSKVKEINDYGCLHRIHPLGSDTDLFDMVNTLRDLFYQLTSIKNKAFINSSQFEKLSNIDIIKECGV